MSLSMYDASVPALTSFLTNLSAILKKGAEYASEKKIEETVLTGARLYPDMFALSRQVQIACDQAKGCAARLAGVEVPSFEDNEQTFAELQARIDKTLQFIGSVAADKINGSEEKPIHLKIGPYELDFTGQSYLLTFTLPNLYFHITTAYNILRHNGVPLGKKDFVGG